MSNSENLACPICKLDAQDVRVTDYGERLSLVCARCGSFTITRSAAVVAQHNGIASKLSAWIREKTESGTDIAEINSQTLNKIEAGLPTYRVSEKQLLLLRALERRTSFPGQTVKIIPLFDFPLAWATQVEELRYILRVLLDRELIRSTEGSPDDGGPITYGCEITAAGWEFLDSRARPSVISDQGFVAMSFAPEMATAWEQGIRPALRKARYQPYWVDAQPHIDRIDNKIIAEIKNSRFLVADVTLQRPGVYFEAGFALGLGIPVFWCVRKDDHPNVHFDTRQYNHIVWENPSHLAEELHTFITAIIGIGSANWRRRAAGGQFEAGEAGRRARPAVPVVWKRPLLRSLGCSFWRGWIRARSLILGCPSDQPRPHFGILDRHHPFRMLSKLNKFDL
jgi:nucleoside 2-deoxyribosyltransferase